MVSNAGFNKRRLINKKDLYMSFMSHIKVSLVEISGIEPLTS